MIDVITKIFYIASQFLFYILMNFSIISKNATSKIFQDQMRRWLKSCRSTETDTSYTFINIFLYLRGNIFPSYLQFINVLSGLSKVKMLISRQYFKILFFNQFEQFFILNVLNVNDMYHGAIYWINISDICLRRFLTIVFSNDLEVLLI